MRMWLAILLLLSNSVNGDEVSEFEVIDGLLNHHKACWKHAEGRGHGQLPSFCECHWERSHLLCYPECKEGFSGAGPLCWSICEEGFTSKGIFCIDAQRKSHLKKSYSRGAGKGLQCNASEEMDYLVLGMCYDKCLNHQKGVGPVCWDVCDGKKYPVDGGAVCCATESVCKKLKHAGLNLPLSIAKAVLDGMSPEKELEDMKSLMESLLGFRLPNCPRRNFF